MLPVLALGLQLFSAMTRSLTCFDYVNHPYDLVRREIQADPQTLFRRATSSGANPQLHVRVGAVDLGAEIAIDILGVEESSGPLQRPTTTFTLEWRSVRGSALFPLMKATLSVYPLTPTETQLELDGTYDPPLGTVGEAIDAVALHGLAKSSVTSFVREVASHLRRSLTNNAT